MKKIPCLFQRVFHDRGKFTLLRDVTTGCEWVLAGDGTASRKWDGTACMVKDGALYKRYDAKRGKALPLNAIPCDEPDPVTGHHPHWVPVNGGEPADKWHAKAWALSPIGMVDGTYELIGPHINGNSEHQEADIFRRHGDVPIHVERTYDSISEYLSANMIEGIVFAHEDGRMCKIRRADFGMPWGAK